MDIHLRPRDSPSSACFLNMASGCLRKPTRFPNLTRWRLVQAGHSQVTGPGLQMRRWIILRRFWDFTLVIAVAALILWSTLFCPGACVFPCQRYATPWWPPTSLLSKIPVWEESWMRWQNSLLCDQFQCAWTGNWIWQMPCPSRKGKGTV